MRETTTALIQDTRRAKKDKTYPVKLRVINNRVVKYYPSKYNLTEEEYLKIFEEKPSKKIKEIRSDLYSLQSKANDIIDKLPFFTFKAFEAKLYRFKTEESDLIQAYTEYASVLRLADRISTAVSYECSINSLKAFKTPLKFEDITVDFLREYEKWMLKSGNSITTVGIYLRALRSIFNEEIANERLSKELYPFGKRKYQIPTGRNTKKALQLSDIKKLFDYTAPSGSNKEWARDIWLFSYLCNGINMKDISRLKYKNIEGNFLTFIRAKTERSTRSNPKPISIFLNDSAKEIIKKWGTKKKLDDNYIFPILEYGCDSKREMQLIQQLIKIVNKWIKKISKEINIEKPVTTYTARHSFSTVLKRSGASVDYISEALGHSNVRTTENYLDSFESEIKQQFSEALLAFETPDNKPKEHNGKI